MTPVFTAIVEKNRLVFDEPDQLALWLGQFIDKKVQVVIKKKTKPRSTGKPWEEGNQNGYYWSVILPISAKELGYTVDEMHEVFTELYAPVVFKDFGGQKVKCRIRTSKMSTVQFMEYTDTIKMKMAEMNIFIPDPNKISN